MQVQALPHHFSLPDSIGPALSRGDNYFSLDVLAIFSGRKGVSVLLPVASLCAKSVAVPHGINGKNLMKDR